jgi:serine/threonine-protein kinase RsbW
MSLPEPHLLETVAGAGTLDEVQAVVEQAWASNAHVPSRVRMEVGIAVAEIAANIVEHAAQGRPIKMRMELRVQPGDVRVEFTDDGIPADVDLASVRLPDDMAERGRGLPLATTALSKLEYRRDHRNHWILISKPFA